VNRDARHKGTRDIEIAPEVFRRLLNAQIVTDLVTPRPLA
jgi:hypothetical protein